MKKILKLLFLIVLFILVLIPKTKQAIKATSVDDVEKPLVLALGGDINAYLKYDDYIVVSNNVNPNQVGTYNVTYKHIETSEVVIKKVIVIDDNNYSYVERLKTLNDDYQYTLKGIANASGMSSFLYKFQIPNFAGDIYMIYENEYATDLVMRSFNGDINDFCYHDGHYIGAGFENSALNKDQDMFMFDLGDTKKLVTVSSAGADYANVATFNNKYYILAGATFSKDGVFNGPRDYYDSCVALVNRENLELEHAFTIGLKGNDEIVDLFEKDNYLYLLQIEDEKNFRLVVTDIFGNKDKELIINEKYGYLNPHFKIVGDNVYLSYASYDYEYLDYCDRIYQMNLNLELTEIYKGYNQGYTLENYEISNDALSLVLKPKYKNYGFLYLEYLKGKLVITHYFDEHLTLYGSDKNHLYFNDNGEIIIYQLNTLFIEEKPSLIYDPKINTTDDLYNYHVLINGASQDTAKNIKEDINPLIFGKYSVTYLFKNANFDYLDTLTIDVLPFIGIMDNETYDLGLCLLGNASKIRVNNEVVSNDYKLCSEGNYKVEIEGKDQEIVKYNIEVKDLRSQVSQTETEQELFLKEVAQENDLAMLTLKKRETVDASKQNYFFMYIVPIMALLSSFIFLRKGGNK